MVVPTGSARPPTRREQGLVGSSLWIQPCLRNREPLQYLGPSLQPCSTQQTQEISTVSSLSNWVQSDSSTLFLGDGPRSLKRKRSPKDFIETSLAPDR